MWIAVVVAGSSLAIALISLVFLLGGYLLVAGLWYVMVYRPSRRDQSERKTPTGRLDERPDHRDEPRSAAGESQDDGRSACASDEA